MATIDLTEATFETTITRPGIVIVDFWAAWCGPCRRFAPIFDKASETHPDITFAKVDTDSQPRLSSSMGISSIPTLMAFRDGIGLFQQAGALPGPALEQLITNLRNLDMDDVRTQVAARSAAG